MYEIEITNHQKQIIIEALVEVRKLQIEQGSEVEHLDEVLIWILQGAPIREGFNWWNLVKKELENGAFCRKRLGENASLFENASRTIKIIHAQKYPPKDWSMDS